MSTDRDTSKSGLTISKHATFLSENLKLLRRNSSIFRKRLPFHVRDI